jgi:hypothetical protein
VYSGDLEVKEATEAGCGISYFTNVLVPETFFLRVSAEVS